MENNNELLFRGVPVYRIGKSDGGIDYKIFRPSRDDRGQLSMFSDIEGTTPEEVFYYYWGDRNKPAPVGVLSIKIKDVEELDLPIIDDPLSDTAKPKGHRLIDFRGYSEDEIKEKSYKLLSKASWSYIHDDFKHLYP